MNERERIEHLMTLYGLSPSQFADRTGIQRASVSHILSNRNKPSLEILLKVYNAFPSIALNWLILGEGDAPVPVNETVDAENILTDIDKNESADNVVAPTLFPSFIENDRIDNSEPSVENDARKESASNTDSSLAKNVPPSVQPNVVDNVTACCNQTTAHDGAVAKASTVAFVRDAAKSIKEIKIFYDNGTYETFLPEKP